MKHFLNFHVNIFDVRVTIISFGHNICLNYGKKMRPVQHWIHEDRHR
jgi:hypothetical protein